ncbi:MAG: hypothetical protein JRN06_03745 [Nitrososphaerota archaeon]|nr:hypothetical protein [Nitrososphaerota archaeon]MDG7022915.1 hypothetical protein [Nitrososphaerota archaeon]
MRTGRGTLPRPTTASPALSLVKCSLCLGFRPSESPMSATSSGQARRWIIFVPEFLTTSAATWVGNWQRKSSPLRTSCARKSSALPRSGVLGPPSGGTSSGDLSLSFFCRAFLNMYACGWVKW